MFILNNEYLKQKENQDLKNFFDANKSLQNNVYTVLFHKLDKGVIEYLLPSLTMKDVGLDKIMNDTYGFKELKNKINETAANFIKKLYGEDLFNEEEFMENADLKYGDNNDYKVIKHIRKSGGGKSEIFKINKEDLPTVINGHNKIYPQHKTFFYNVMFSQIFFYAQNKDQSAEPLPFISVFKDNNITKYPINISSNITVGESKKIKISLRDLLENKDNCYYYTNFKNFDDVIPDNFGNSLGFIDLLIKSI